jgi:pimeloyl-ACP methyl ester carboxylesterase
VFDQSRLPDDLATAGGAVESPDGTPIAYLRVGTGPALVVCHGSFASAQDWLPFAVEMADTCSVYLYDRRGRGSSPYVSPDFAVDAEVDDLSAVLRIAGPEPALLGHSFGGGCALSCAARERFGGPVIVYEPRHSVDGPVSAGHIPEIRRLLADGEREAAVRTILEKVVGLSASRVAAFADSPLWERMRQTVDAFPDELRLLDRLAWRPGDLDDIAGPTWLLVGEESPVLPADREDALRGILPGLRKVTLRGQGHFAYLSAPRALARAVRECLGAPDTAPTPVFETDKDDHDR